MKWPFRIWNLHTLKSHHNVPPTPCYPEQIAGGFILLLHLPEKKRIIVTMKLGKDGRKLSSYQQKEWMESIGKKRKYKNQARGESSGVSKLLSSDINTIRRFKSLSRNEVYILARIFDISPRHVYSIRARKCWKHI